MMDDQGKSHSPIVPEKSPNKAPSGAAEGTEGRGLAKGKTLEQNTLRTQGREGGATRRTLGGHEAGNSGYGQGEAPTSGRQDSVQHALERIREAAKDRTKRFTALYHHVYSLELLRKSYFGLKREAAPGIDGETWRHYGEQLEEHLHDLSWRLKQGAYRARPARRAYIPKTDGRKRPIGVMVLEDKIVQRAVTEVLNAIYEEDFLGFSYGFRPKRSAHKALDILSAGIMARKVNWVLDADILNFFGTLDWGWLITCIERRIGDRRIMRLIQKWLKAGVLEEGKWTASEVGTVQGGSISPLLANIYLHYVFDLWVHHWRKTRAEGDVIVVRYADDFMVGFQHRREAERFLADLRERFARFGLALHPDKTRILEFGRFAREDRSRRGEGKPETFNFLGFTHICGENTGGKFTVIRRTMRTRLQAKLKEVYQELKRRMHDPVPEQGAYLRSVVGGHIRFYGVPTNRASLSVFRKEVGRLWWKALRRRSQKHRMTVDRLKRLVDRWLPPARIWCSHPRVRGGVRT
jgi:group II intron reverse transcriptase/maturase